VCLVFVCKYVLCVWSCSKLQPPSQKTPNPPGRDTGSSAREVTVWCELFSSGGPCLPAAVHVWFLVGSPNGQARASTPSQRQAPAFKFFKLEPAAKLSGSSLSLSSYIPFYFSQNLSSLPSSSKLPFSRRIAAVLPFKLQTSSSGSSESTSYFQ